MPRNRDKSVNLVVDTVRLFLYLVVSMTSFFLLGDSISIHYGPFLKERIAAWATLGRKEGHIGNLDIAEGANGGDSTLCLDYLTACFKKPDFKYDWLLLNCGAHDIRRGVEPPYALQTPPEKYAANLDAIAALTRRHRQRLIWITTCPVFEEVHNKPSAMFHRFHADVKAYNAIARQWCERNDIPILDLYAFTLPHCPFAFCDHAHFAEPFRVLQAQFLATELKTIGEQY